MIPDTLLSLALFAASAGPGYVFVRVAERREPRVQRTALLEAAELVIVGAVSTGVSALVVLVVADSLGWLDLRALVDGGRAYLLDEPVRTLGSLLVVLLLSYFVAWLAARFIYRGVEASLRPDTVWRQVIKTSLERGPVFASVRLRNGQAFDGYVYAFTVEGEMAERELGLQRPIFARRGDERGQLLNADYLVIANSEIAYLTFQTG